MAQYGPHLGLMMSADLQLNPAKRLATVHPLRSDSGTWNIDVGQFMPAFLLSVILGSVGWEFPKIRGPTTAPHIVGP